MIDNKIFKMSAKNIKNALGKDGEEFADGLIDLLDMMRQDEQTFTMEDVKAEVEKYLADKVVTEEKVEEVANALFAKKIAEVQNNLGGKKVDTKAIQNAYAKELFTANGKKDALAKAKKVANDISGITAPDVIDYVVSEKWGNQAPFYAKLNKVPFNKFLYSEQTLEDAKILAHQWNKSSKTAKKIQEITTLERKIDTDYIYKRQKFAQVDLDAIKASGDEVRALKWVQDELVRQTTNTIVNAIVCGDQQSGTDKITTFESIGAKKESDPFTLVTSKANAQPIELEDLVNMVRGMHNPDQKEISLFVDKAILANISKFVYATGGSAEFRSNEELAKTIGVSEIIPYDIHALSKDANLHAVAIMPDEYWVKEVNEIAVVYPKYENNETNFQYEVNAGGKAHGLMSTAVLRSAEA